MLHASKACILESMFQNSRISQHHARNFLAQDKASSSFQASLGKPSGVGGNVSSITNKKLPLGTASVWTHDDAVFHIQVLPYPPKRARLRIQVVYWDVEETLDLASMQIHGDDMVAARSLKHVRHQFRGDWCSRLVFLVLAGIRKVGDYGGYAACGGGFAGIDHDEQLHKSVIDIARGRGLQNED